MKATNLRGWQVTAQKVYIPDQIDPDWALIFTETQPPTGDQIVFQMNKDVRDAVVRMLTDGIVLAGGDLPRL